MKIYLLLFLLITSLFSKDTITWMKWDLPPNFIVKGELKGTGYQDFRLKMLQKRLPQYNHTSIVMNINRAIQTYKAKNDSQTIYCTNDIISHPTLDIDDYLSIAVFPFQGFYLVTTKDKAHLFGKEGETVVLKDIIKNTNLKLVISKNRPYLGAGKVMDEYIKTHPNQTHITALSTLNIGKSMFGLVAKDRADYTFEYINKVTYYGKQMGVLNKTVIYPMAENQDTYYGFISCIKTPKGKQVINKVNTIIKEIKYDEKWITAFTNWLPTKKLQDDYLKYYKEVFLLEPDRYDTNARSR